MHLLDIACVWHFLSTFHLCPGQRYHSTYLSYEMKYHQFLLKQNVNVHFEGEAKLPVVVIS